eukprot:6201546-Pleurochrysis_carterae.AAC.4
MREYERLALNHFESGSTQPAPHCLNSCSRLTVWKYLVTIAECAQEHSSVFVWALRIAQAALITCERNQACFGKWARPFAFHARMLQQLDRDEEASPRKPQQAAASLRKLLAPTIGKSGGVV